MTLKSLNINNVDAMQVAVGSADGTVAFVMSESGHDAQQGLAEWQGQRGKRSTLNVPMRRLSSLCDERGLQPGDISFMKVDVEGSEAGVFSGFESWMRDASPPIVLFEINKEALAANRSSPTELVAFLSRYALFFVRLGCVDEPFRTIGESVSALPPLVNVVGLPLSGKYSARAGRATVRAFLAS